MARHVTGNDSLPEIEEQRFTPSQTFELPHDEMPATVQQPDGDQPLTNFRTVFYSRDGGNSSEIALLSNDKVLFNSSRKPLLAASANEFGNLLHEAAEETIDVPFCAEALNLLLHYIYRSDLTTLTPNLEILEETFKSFETYGVRLDWSGARFQPFNDMFLEKARQEPLQAYAIAASNDWEYLAREASALCLNASLFELSEQVCLKMGPVYLNRLALLHQNRIERLKSFIRESPDGHKPTQSCNELDQKRLKDQWGVVGTSLIWEITADYANDRLRETFQPLMGATSCDFCKRNMESRVVKLIIDWSSTKRTI